MKQGRRVGSVCGSQCRCKPLPRHVLQQDVVLHPLFRYHRGPQPHRVLHTSLSPRPAPPCPPRRPAHILASPPAPRRPNTRTSMQQAMSSSTASLRGQRLRQARPTPGVAAAGRRPLRAQALFGFLAPPKAKAGAGKAQELVGQLLELVERSDGGLSTPPAKREEIAELVAELEGLGTRNPLRSPLLFGDYEVVYTSKPQAAGGAYRSPLGRVVFPGQRAVQRLAQPNICINEVLGPARAAFRHAPRVGPQRPAFRTRAALVACAGVVQGAGLHPGQRPPGGRVRGGQRRHPQGAAASGRRGTAVVRAMLGNARQANHVCGQACPPPPPACPAVGVPGHGQQGQERPPAPSDPDCLPGRAHQVGWKRFGGGGGHPRRQRQRRRRHPRLRRRQRLRWRRWRRRASARSYAALLQGDRRTAMGCRVARAIPPEEAEEAEPTLFVFRRIVEDEDEEVRPAEVPRLRARIEPGMRLGEHASLPLASPPLCQAEEDEAPAQRAAPLSFGTRKIKAAAQEQAQPARRGVLGTQLLGRKDGLATMAEKRYAQQQGGSRSTGTISRKGTGTTGRGTGTTSAVRKTREELAAERAAARAAAEEERRAAREAAEAARAAAREQAAKAKAAAEEERRARQAQL